MCTLKWYINNYDFVTLLSETSKYELYIVEESSHVLVAAANISAVEYFCSLIPNIHKIHAKHFSYNYFQTQHTVKIIIFVQKPLWSYYSLAFPKKTLVLCTVISLIYSIFKFFFSYPKVSSSIVCELQNFGSKSLRICLKAIKIFRLCEKYWKLNRLAYLCHSCHDGF